MDDLALVAARASDADGVMEQLDAPTLERTEVWVQRQTYDRWIRDQSKLACLSPVDEVDIAGVGPCVRLGDGPDVQVKNNESLSDTLFRLGFQTKDAEEMQAHLQVGDVVFLVPSRYLDHSGTTVYFERHADVDVVRPDRNVGSVTEFKQLRGGTRVSRDVRPVQFTTGFPKA